MLYKWFTAETLPLIVHASEVHVGWWVELGWVRRGMRLSSANINWVIDSWLSSLHGKCIQLHSWSDGV